MIDLNATNLCLTYGAFAIVVCLAVPLIVVAAAESGNTFTGNASSRIGATSVPIASYGSETRASFSVGRDKPTMNAEIAKDRVCIIGSGNWGSAIATLVGRNCARLSNYEDVVSMWVYEEDVAADDGSPQKLTHIINTRHENVKYLPGIRLPDNVVAVPDLATACRGATLLVFVLPHQFLPNLLPVIRESAHPRSRGVSLIKGLGTLD
jgi:NAD-dependent glycerol-3-phosphate dehydrogenase N-terminus